MVEVGSIQIGGSIQTQDIERGLKRVEQGFSHIEAKGKSVNADFERMNQQTSRLAKTLGIMAITGAGALIAIAKGAPATAGAMAKIKVSAMKLKFAIGEALQDEFEAFSGFLGKVASWVQEHPDVFSGIVKSVIGLGIVAGALKIGGWIWNIFSGFWGLLKKIAGFVFPKLIPPVVTPPPVAPAGPGFGTTASGIGGFSGTLGAGIAIGIGPLINTYQREITGEPGFLDKMLQRVHAYQQKQMSRQDWENQISYTL